MKPAGSLGRTRTRAGRPQGPGHGTRPVPRGSPPGSPHRPPSRGLASAGYGLWDLLKTLARTKTCGPAGSLYWLAVPFGARLPLVFAGFLVLPCFTAPGRPSGCAPPGPSLRNARIPWGPPSVARAPLDFVASAIRWAVDHMPLVWGRHGPRLGSSGLARPLQVKGPRAWGERAAPPGPVRLHWGARRAGPPPGVLPPRLLGHQPGPGERPVPAASAHWGPGRAGRWGSGPPGPPGGSRTGASRKHAPSSV